MIKSGSMSAAAILAGLTTGQTDFAYTSVPTDPQAEVQAEKAMIESKISALQLRDYAAASFSQTLTPDHFLEQWRNWPNWRDWYNYWRNW